MLKIFYCYRKICPWEFRFFFLFWKVKTLLLLLWAITKVCFETLPLSSVKPYKWNWVVWGFRMNLSCFTTWFFSIRFFFVFLPFSTLSSKTSFYVKFHNNKELERAKKKEDRNSIIYRTHYPRQKQGHICSPTFYSSSRQNEKKREFIGLCACSQYTFTFFECWMCSTQHWIQIIAEKERNIFWRH